MGEQPAPVQLDFLLQKFVKEAQADPSPASKQPYKAIIEKDQSFFADVAVQKPEAIQSLLEAVGKAWEGTTPDEFEADVKGFLATAKDKTLFMREQRRFLFKNEVQTRIETDSIQN